MTVAPDMVRHEHKPHLKRGARGSYSAGCRCDDCKLAQARHDRHRYLTRRGAVPCAWCSEPFFRRVPTQKFCSMTCSERSRRPTMRPDIHKVRDVDSSSRKGAA